MSADVVELAKQYLLERAHQLDGLIISDYGNKAVRDYVGQYLVPGLRLEPVSREVSVPRNVRSKEWFRELCA